MFTEIDEGKGLVKTYWSKIRERVNCIEPEFVKIVDALNPDKTYPLYLAYYPYGDLIGDTETTFIPKSEGGRYKLSDPNLSKDIIKNLSYGKNDSPLGMVLEKQFEQFIDLKEEGITIPWSIYTPGAFVSFRRKLNKVNDKRIYSPNGVLTAISGARSTFVLPSIGCTVNHLNLQRDFNITSPAPKSLYEHFNIFKEIIDSGVIKCDWKCCIIYFSEKWVKKIQTDDAWLKLRLYLHEFAWSRFQYEINRTNYEFGYSLIQKSRNLKPNPYLVDTARQLFSVAVGASPAYVSPIDNNALPLTLLQQAMVESYGLKKYYPNIMQPAHFNFEQDKLPAYYSLQYPSTPVFSPKSRKVTSTLSELRELAHIMRVFIEESSKDNNFCSDTILNKIAKNIRLQYFHSEIDQHKIIMPSDRMASFDWRFKKIDPQFALKGMKFASDGPFVRGCISIQRNDAS